MEIKTGTADFSAPISGSGPRKLVVPVIFPTTIDKAVVGITGYSAAFGDNDDHNIGLLDVEVSADINNNVVLVNATLGLRDWSGDWDDSYFGSIDFAVIAELAAAPARADLAVADVEFNQAVQFFKSASYLSAATSLPDNAIPLYAGKNTGLRVYPDWDAGLGLPLSAVTGSVTVKLQGGATIPLSPLNPAPIAPASADTINMAVIEQTLNFMIPGAFCHGQVEITIQLWDPANPASKTALYTRTIVFNDLPQLNIFVVGVHYTANGLNLPAPTQAAFTAQGFAYLQQVYPMGTILQTGYLTIDWSEDVNFTIGSQGGCGDGMNDLLDQLDDMQGSSNDIYLGVLPPLAQIQTPGSNIGGCGQVSQGIVFVDQTADVPHEIGHALGRNHAPCDPGQCNPQPANVDDHYPSYGALPAGSIGAFGFDPIGYQVLNPASTFDTMAYRFPQWISAYTYLALAGAGHPSEGGSSSGGLGGAHALTGVPIETLFLGLQVNRDRSVCRRVSFHFKAVPRSQKPCSCFTAELLSVERKVLLCMPLSCNCADAGHNCWPKKLRSALPYPAGSRWLAVYEDEKKIHEEWIPDPPKVTIEAVEERRDEVIVRWCGEHQHDADPCNRCCELWYLVQWLDAEDGVWRGVAPRTRETQMRLPLSLLKVGGAVEFRVLASCGIATGMATFRAKGKGRQNPTVGLIGHRLDNSLNTVISAVPVDAQGRHVRTQQETWVVDGREVARGASIDLRSLPQGMSDVQVFLYTEAGQFSQHWAIERAGASFRLCDVGDQRFRPLRHRTPTKKS